MNELTAEIIYQLLRWEAFTEDISRPDLCDIKVN